MNSILPLEDTKNMTSSIRPVKIGLIGPGNWGYQHARVFSQRPDVDFCAVVGRNPIYTNVFADRFGVRAYTDVDDMLIKEEPDLVSLSLPNLEHFLPTMSVIEAGIPLLVEKPLVFNLDEADRLLNAAAEKNLFFAINFNHRFARAGQLAHEAVIDGRVGDIICVNWYFAGDWQPDHPWMTLIESQCHGFDMVEYLCGPIESIMAQMTDKSGHGFSTVALSLKFVNGAVGSMTGGYDASFKYKNAQRLEIVGTAGRITIEDTVQRFTYQAAGEEHRTTWEAGYFNDHDRQFFHTMDNHIELLLDAFRRGGEPPVHARCGRRALALALAAISSFESGLRTVVPLEQIQS